MSKGKKTKEKTPKKVILVRGICIVIAASILLPIIVYTLL